MDWQATDQFGNLNIAQSSAESFESLRPDLTSIINELIERAGQQFQLTIDFDFQEVNGPDPESVSHILRIPWLSTLSKDDACQEISSLLTEICQEMQLGEVTVCIA